MKKIAFVLPDLGIGGVERAIINLLREIDYSRYEVTLWLENIVGESLSLVDSRVHICEIENQTPKHILKERLKHGKLIQALSCMSNLCLARLFCNNYILNLRYIAKCRALCSQDKYDCLIAYKGLAFDQIITTRYRFRADKFVCWIHGRKEVSDEIRGNLLREYSRFDRIINVSKATRDAFVRIFPEIADKTSVMYNLLDTSEVIRCSHETVDGIMKEKAIVTVGRLASEKGQQMVPKTVRILLDQGYDIHWYLVGDGPLRAEVEQECEKYGVQDRVILLGTKMNPYPYIKNCDIYVQPSFTEGYCTTTVEAKILHKPVVTTDAPGMREQFVSGENGLIVDAMTPEAIAEGVRQLLDHPELMEKFTNALKNESIDNSAELQKLYDFIES